MGFLGRRAASASPKSHKPISLCERYGDDFADLDQLNQYFADIARDPNYDPDQITSIKPTTSYKNSEDTTCEYEV